jgi:hypothetical protein
MMNEKNTDINILIPESLEPMLRKLRMLLDVCKAGLNGYDRLDLMSKFGITEITLHRDLNWLRSKGIKIHSCKCKVTLFSDINCFDVKKMIEVLELISAFRNSNHFTK